MECYCYLRNIEDLLSDGKTLSERRFGELFFEDPLFRLELWSNVTLFLLNTCRDCISSATKTYQEYSSVM